MDDFKKKLEDFLQPTNLGAYSTKFPQQQEKLYEEAYNFRYPPKHLTAAEGYDHEKNEYECWNKLAELSDNLDKDQSNGYKGPEGRAWNIWLTAKCSLLTTTLEDRGKYMTATHLRMELGYCTTRAQYAKTLFKKGGDPAWETMEDVLYLCDEMRKEEFKHRAESVSQRESRRS
ncbi:MAG: hypothetical protein Q9213_000699 [Squamulea squamosa]